LLRQTLVTLDATRLRAMWQILLLAAGFLVLTGISTSSVILVNQARDDNDWLVHTVEVQDQISTVLLDVRRAESAERGYILTADPQFLAEQEAAAASIIPDVDKLLSQSVDNPVQVELGKQLRSAVAARISEFGKATDLVEHNDTASAANMLRERGAGDSIKSINEVANAMRSEEGRLFALRSASTDRSQRIASIVTVAGSGMVIALAGVSIFLVRRSARARDEAEARLRDNNLNLEATVDERTADLREANDEIQRFAYIVSHDLRSPLVNIMGFTSELEQLHTDIFRRIATLHGAATASAGPLSAGEIEPVLDDEDKQRAQDFTEALSFIKSSIAKMDRLITAILNLTRQGRRDFEPERIDTRELIEAIVTTMAHQAAEAEAQIDIGPLPGIVSDRLALEQIFSNLIDNALKYLKPGVPGHISVQGRSRLGFAIFEIIDNGRGIDPSDHQRIFDLFRRAGPQDRPGQGIGLAHVRALVRRLGGTMSVSSELHNGSTFTITLPLAWTASNRNRDT
jgi:signal transduction histidine kinase